MLGITIICVGSLKEDYLKKASDEYRKRLSILCNLNIIEIAEERVSKNPSKSEISGALEKEGIKILNKIPSGAKIVTLCIEGNQMASDKLSQWIENIAVLGSSHVCFIIGSSFGISEQIKSQSGLKLSMSLMTFPHQLARVMLLEQVYRSFQITNKTKYHK